MSFVSSAAYKTATTLEQTPCIALVTGARSGIGLALARKIASFPFVEKVLAVSRSITDKDVATEDAKFLPVAADVATSEGRHLVVSKVRELCGPPSARTKQLRFLIHSAGTIEPIKPVLEVEPEELRRAMLVNCEAPFFLTTALHGYMKPLPGGDVTSVSGRVLHVSSGAAHGAPPVGWAAYGISKAAFLQSYRVLERELRGTGVVVGSFKPGVVDTSMQGVIRSAQDEVMPVVRHFIRMKDQMGTAERHALPLPRPPPKGALDTPDNVAYFAEFLLLGTTDAEYAHADDDDANEWDIRDASNFPRWIPAEHLSESGKE